MERSRADTRTREVGQGPWGPSGSTGDVAARVLFIEQSQGFGGSTVGLARLVAGLPPRIEPRVIVSHERHREYLVGSGLGHVPTDVVSMRPARFPRPPGSSKLRSAILALATPSLATLDQVMRLVPYVKEMHARLAGERIDVVHVNNSVSANLGGILLARMLNAACVVKQRGFEWRSWDIRQVARSIDHYLPDSEAVAQDLVDLGVDPERITVTYCTLDLSDHRVDETPAAIRAEFSVPAGAPVFGIVACLLPWKGQRVFLDAAARVLGEFPDGRAVIVGAPPDGAEDAYSRGLREQAASLGIADRVVFTGHRDDVPRMLAMMDVCVHASVKPEPFGTVIAEAMATGRPVVASRAGGPVEYVLDGRTGLLAEPGDPASLADGVLRLLRDPGQAARLAEAGRDLVATRFNLERHVAASVRVYEDLVRERRAATGS